MVRANRRVKEEKEEDPPISASPTKKLPAPKKSVAPKKAIKAKEAAAVAAKEAEEKKVVEPTEETPTAETEEEPKKPVTKKVKKADEKEKTEEEKPDEEEKTEEKKDVKTEEPEEEDPNAIWAPTDFDVLSGRGASVNSHGGNKKFRALCFANKPQFEAGNHAAKRRIATEIVDLVFNGGEARFLKRKSEKGPWLVLTKEQAILKACQVMRDYKRPDRIAQRQMMAANGQARKRVRQVESTPLPEDYVAPSEPLPPIVENPFGVHDHDILCGRGAFVNGHIGNQRLRTLAQERKTAFDAGNYTEKRSLANEIVSILKALDPPGRFLKRASKKSEDETDKKDESKDPESEWEELGDEKAIHKACQVMRDIDRPDRKDREERRLKKKQKLTEKKIDKVDDKNDERRKKDEEEAVSEAVAATEEALDKALDAADTKVKEEISKAGEKAVEV